MSKVIQTWAVKGVDMEAEEKTERVFYARRVAGISLWCSGIPRSNSDALREIPADMKMMDWFKPIGSPYQVKITIIPENIIEEVIDPEDTSMNWLHRLWNGRYGKKY